MQKQSIVTEYTDISAFSGLPAECHHHLVFGNGLRKLADEDFIWLPLTNAEHNMSPNGNLYQIHGNPVAEKLSKMLGQMAFEKEYYRIIYRTDREYYGGGEEDIAREQFRKRYGISYL